MEALSVLENIWEIKIDIRIFLSCLQESINLQKTNIQNIVTLYSNARPMSVLLNYNFAWVGF